MTGCTCHGDEQMRANGSFWCQRHQCWKTQHRLGLCRHHAGYFDLWEDGRGPGQKHKPGLGDMVAAGLEKIGVTKQRVSKLLGRPCKCGQRQKLLNKLGRKIGIGR